MYSISKDKLPDPPEPPRIEKMELPPPSPKTPQELIFNQSSDGNSSNTIIIVMVILVIIIIIALGVAIYFFIEKDKEISSLTKDLEDEKNKNDKTKNDITCDCPEIPKCPACPPAPECPTTICPDCPSTNDMMNSMFPGRSIPNNGGRDFDLINNQDIDSYNKKKKIVQDSLDIKSNFEKVKKNIEDALGKSLTNKDKKDN